MPPERFEESAEVRITREADHDRRNRILFTLRLKLVL